MYKAAASVESKPEVISNISHYKTSNLPSFFDCDIDVVFKVKEWVYVYRNLVHI